MTYFVRIIQRSNTSEIFSASKLQLYARICTCTVINIILVEGKKQTVDQEKMTGARPKTTKKNSEEAKMSSSKERDSIDVERRFQAGELAMMREGFPVVAKSLRSSRMYTDKHSAICGSALFMNELNEVRRQERAAMHRDMTTKFHIANEYRQEKAIERGKG